MKSTITIFKTSAEKLEDIDKIKPYLDLLYAVRHWDFAIGSGGSILRVNRTRPVSEFIVRMMGMFGMKCEELKYDRIPKSLSFMNR